MARLRRVLLITVLAASLTAACTTQPEVVMPTRAVLPTVTPTEAVTAAPTQIVTPTLSLPTAVPSTTPIPSATAVILGDIPAMERRLYDTPIFENFASDSVRAIFALGRSLGNRANVFTTVGDSNTTNGDFLQPIGMGADVYCAWGSYDDLHETVAYFSAPPNAEAKTSFTHQSLAAKMGFTSVAALDPLWAPDTVCAPDESSVACEYRAVQPSIAIIMLGNIDINGLSTAAYNANMRAIVQTSAAHGVIPVLSTFVVIPERDGVYERSLEFNMMLLDIAEAGGIPLINLWAAAQTLPDHGIGPDRTHLKAVVGSFCSFDGAQSQYGGTLRNLLTLQALDMLRRDVLTAAG